MAIQALFFEFIVIVIGILSALFIDHLIEKRNHRQRINSIMNIVIDNMKKDLEKIKIRLELLDDHSNLFDKFIKDPNDDILKKCEKIPVTVFYIFKVRQRGYNLLKDASINFEFKESNLISEIVSSYKLWIHMFDSIHSILQNEAENNTKYRSSFNWFHDVFFNKNNSNQDFLEYLRTDEFKRRITYKFWIEKTVLTRYLTEYKNSLEILLKKIEVSDYR